MRFEPLEIEGAYKITPELHEDSRGYFTRTYCRREFLANGLNHDFVQESISFNRAKGTFRGMHFQVSPHEEVKLVRCQKGKALDIILDLRKESKSYMQWQSFEISNENKTSIYIPRGCAHGFLTLEDNTELFYLINTYYQSQFASGVRWNDPSFGIELPIPIEAISLKDLEFADYV